MSVQHANRGIVKKDLQLYYNREYNGSFLGEATMNFFSIPVFTLQKEGNHSTSFSTSTSSGIPDLIVSGNKQVYYVSDYYTLVATGAWVAESNRLIIYPKRDASGGATSFAPSGTYRISFYARSLSGNTALGFAFYSNAINNTATLTSKWQRFSANSTYSNGAMIIEFGNLNAGSMVCQIACIQVEAKSYATPFTVPVLWTPNLYNVTSTSGHTTMTKNPVGNGWNTARVYSSEGYSVPCYVSFKSSQTTAAVMIGLNSDPSIGVDYTYLDYAFYLDSPGYTAIYESGANPVTFGNSTYTTSTIFEIIYDGTNINYYMDGVLKRTVARSGSGPLYLDSSFWSNNAVINSLSFGPLSQMNRFSNYKIGGGGLLDISGNNVNANLTNVLFNSSGYYFNGSSNSIYLGTELNLQNGTICAWVNPAISTATTYHGIITKTSGGTTGTQTWYIDWMSGNALRGGIGDSSGAEVVTQTWNPTISTWYFITFVFDSSYLYLYMNGVLFVTPVARTRICQNTAHPVYIGRAYEQASYAWNGQIGQVTINRTALTAAEVLQNFNATRKTYGI
jgi:hypothetical protein